MKALSIDIETLGTLVDSQILSIGLAMFNLKTGKIGNTLYLPISMDINKHINATLGTITFWVKQAVDNPKALDGLFTKKQYVVDMVGALCKIQVCLNISFNNTN